MPAHFKMIGERFNRLVVLSEQGKSNRGYDYLCQCDCGNQKVINGSLIRKNQVRSCGCIKSEIIKKKNTTHGLTKSPAYQSWQAMKNRCLNENQKSFNNYGGRGIEICKSWLSFENFIADMGERPIGTTLERIDNNKGYSKENCKWATITEQSRNTRQVVNLTFQGKSMCMMDWAKETGIPYPTIQDRRNRGWSTERILTR